jgi:flagellar motor protein MotB
MSVIQQMAPEAPDDIHKDGQSSTQASLDSASEQALRDALAKKEQDSFASAAQSLRQSLQDMPELAELSKQIMIDQTPEGLRIQLIDQEGRSMFKENSREPNDRAKILLRAVAKVINQLPNRITVSGHTSASARQASRQRLGPVGRARRRLAPGAARRRGRRRPHLSGLGQGQFRAAVRRRPHPGGQSTHLDRAAA